VALPGLALPAGPTSKISQGAAGRVSVEGYDPSKHDRFFEQAQGELADKGFITAAADDLITWARTGR
jgi:NADH-quinone oxidoreductase subunit B